MSSEYVAMSARTHMGIVLLLLSLAKSTVQAVQLIYAQGTTVP